MGSGAVLSWPSAKQFCEADVEGIGDRGQRLQMGCTLARSIMERKETLIRARSLNSSCVIASVTSSAAGSCVDFPDDGRLYGPLPGFAAGRVLPAAPEASKDAAGETSQAEHESRSEKIVGELRSAAL